jgi:hypothetical protein
MTWYHMNEQDASSPAVHTPGCPYCKDGECACHTDADYHELVTDPLSDENVDEEVLQFARDFFGVS